MFCFYSCFCLVLTSIYSAQIERKNWLKITSSFFWFSMRNRYTGSWHRISLHFITTSSHPVKVRDLTIAIPFLYPCLFHPPCYCPCSEPHFILPPLLPLYTSLLVSSLFSSILTSALLMQTDWFFQNSGSITPLLRKLTVVHSL